ncbi:MAG: DEAD/DEAH box helicase, partial [Culicoidibacterales bacterium]
TEQFITEYEQIYNQTSQSWQAVTQPQPVIQELKPNTMQIQALRAIDRLYDAGEKRGLLVSATGTGKTYLSAFHVKRKNPQRFLFLVHRETIARAAQASFANVLGSDVALGLYTGTQKDEADYLFATIQTMSMPEHLAKFASNYFDYIVIDETHRAGAKSYQAIMNHFQPRFLLGMTATPERTDGFDIFSQFDHNLAYEIRLQEALAQEMLCPFHYYAISELELDGEVIDEKSEFNRLVQTERIDHVYKQMKFYGCDDGNVRGLIFCSRNEEAEFFAKALNSYGLRTLALSGATPEIQRREAIQRLELPETDSQKLDYLLTVDIFNEGIDIPAVNQVVMLRPTQSAIIFVQQLGRGLRKTEGKEYLTVVDFIGNSLTQREKTCESFISKLS